MSNDRREMSTIGKALYSEFIAGRTVFDWCFLLTGLLLQIVVFIVAPTEPIMIVSGIAGVITVILCSQGKISYYAFGFVQVGTYLVIVCRQHLYGAVGINIFYAVTMVYGLFLWIRRYHINASNGSAELQTRKLTPTWTAVLIVVVIAGSALVGWMLSTFTNDSDPYLDAFTTVPAIAAQMLMIFGYREQWIFWFCIDVGTVWLWVRAGNWSMATLYAFWCINGIKGYYHWTQSAQQ